jgi:cytochrome c oxidase subunit 3
MWLFLISDSITFGAMLVAYVFLRVGSPSWPRPFQFVPSIVNATVMTFVLLSSSVTMVAAVEAAKNGRTAAAVRWLGATMLGGIIFDILHIREWLGLIHEGVRLFSNPWGTPIFGASFFGLTGLHMTHVTVGVVYLAFVAVGFGRGKYNGRRRRSQRPVLALCRSRLDVYLPAGLSDLHPRPLRPGESERTHGSRNAASSRLLEDGLVLEGLGLLAHPYRRRSVSGIRTARIALDAGAPNGHLSDESRAHHRVFYAPAIRTPKPVPDVSSRARFRAGHDGRLFAR